MTDQPEIEYVDDAPANKPPIYAFVVFVLGIIMSLVAWVRLKGAYVGLEELNLPAQFDHLGAWIGANYTCGWMFALLGILANVSMLCRQRFGLVFGWLSVLCALISSFATMSVWIAIREVAQAEHATTFLFGFSWRIAYVLLYMFALFQFAGWSEQLKKRVAPPRILAEPAWAEYELQKMT